MKQAAMSIQQRLRLGAWILVSVPLFAGAATLECTAKVSGKLNNTQMKKMARIAMADAQATAIRSIGPSNLERVMGKELEVEHGCLLYSFDLRLRSKDGIDEVQIDAVSGKVISSKHETAAAEAAEKSADAQQGHKSKSSSGSAR